MLFSIMHTVSQFMADLRRQDERVVRECVQSMLPDPELEFAFAAAAYAPVRAMEATMHAAEMSILKCELAAARQDAEIAHIDATHWRLRAQYSERRLAELTKE